MSTAERDVRVEPEEDDEDALRAVVAIIAATPDVAMEVINYLSAAANSGPLARYPDPAYFKEMTDGLIETIWDVFLDWDDRKTDAINKEKGNLPYSPDKPGVLNS